MISLCPLPFPIYRYEVYVCEDSPVDMADKPLQVHMLSRSSIVLDLKSERGD